MGCLSCLGGCVINVITWVAQLLKTACAVAIILIVCLQLTNVGMTFNTTEQSVTYFCVLGTNNGQSLCTYAYIGRYAFI